MHQQLLTDKKLFCRCPAGLFQKKGEYDAEVIRHMRPTLSEMGGYDGTALMERRTRKNIFYHLAHETACTYDIDDTPPFIINRTALDISIELGVLLGCSMVGELHITRKQYLDGSIPAGFQRTAIVGIDGEIELPHKKVGITQISIEEDSCREVSDIGHDRVYTTDRLGMPLSETVTDPVLLTPDEAEMTAEYIRFLARSTGRVRTGAGAAREDVNVSISGGTRVEIKGVSSIKLIPELTHNEAFRQKSLLVIKKEIKSRGLKETEWKIKSQLVQPEDIVLPEKVALMGQEGKRLIAINLPGFKNLLAHFTQPGQTFADEISGRLKIIACLDQPNMMYSDCVASPHEETFWNSVSDLLQADKNDSHIILWASDDDISTALETIDERCRLAWIGVPNETRKSLPNGTTIFERVLPGADRMYPDTDSAPIAIDEEMIERAKSTMAVSISDRLKQLDQWKIPKDSHTYLLRNNLLPVIEKICSQTNLSHKTVADFLTHRLRDRDGHRAPQALGAEQIVGLFDSVMKKNLEAEILYELLPLKCTNHDATIQELLSRINYAVYDENELLSEADKLQKQFLTNCTTKREDALIDFLIGQLRPKALGNIKLTKLKALLKSRFANV